MVMANRPEVRTASAPIAAVDLVGLAQQMLNALVRVPFRRPWRGPSGPAQNIGIATTREVLRTFMGYSSSLPIEEFRSVELTLDRLCQVVMPPIVAARGVTTHRSSVGSVSGLWYRPTRREPRATIVYLHGGGYIGTSPTMYGAFVAELVRETECDVFVADYRLAPEFPFPAGLDDAVTVLKELVRTGTSASRLFIAGDSGGGGLAAGLMCAAAAGRLPRFCGLVLFSPEVDLRLDKPSVTENANLDILPWNIPTTSYLQGADPGAGCVSAINQNVDRWPSTFVAFGHDEMFRDAIRLLVDRLDEAGVSTVAIEDPGMFHVFPIFMPWAAASQRVYHVVGEFVRRTMHFGILSRGSCSRLSSARPGSGVGALPARQTTPRASTLGAVHGIERCRRSRRGQGSRR